MKKVASLLLALCLGAFVVGCNSAEDEKPAGGTGTTSGGTGTTGGGTGTGGAGDAP